MTDKGVTLRELKERPVTDLNGVNAKKAESLGKISVTSVLDLITVYPRRYIDRSKQINIDDLTVGEEGMILVTVSKVTTRRMRNRRSLVEVSATDETGSMRLVFFNQPWRVKQLSEGKEIIIFGRLDLYQGHKQMTNPIVDLVGDRTGRIVAVYPQSEIAGVQSWDLDTLIAEALRRVMKVRGFEDSVPEKIRDRYRLVDRSKAFHQIHRPDSMQEVAEARRRLVFDELLRIQLELVQRKIQLEKLTKGISHKSSGGLEAKFHQELPYELTDAQKRVINEISGDLESHSPMHRLLQGDVGSGKTVVAVTALLSAVESGYQGAFMAPTEVLAEQHYSSISKLLENIEVKDDLTLLEQRPLRIELLTSNISAIYRRELLQKLSNGEIDIVVGTHALIQDEILFASLGVVVIDEQHRFGVDQRAALKEKQSDGVAPNVLVMTATPIPRTAAMTVYGDLDVSVLDEMPPGRIPIRTLWVREEQEAWESIFEEVREGRQAYVVCPLIDESDSLNVRSVEETFSRLSKQVFPDLRVELLHGRIKTNEKNEIMEKFRAGNIDVLVATTVIEVGVDVPNATVMVVLDADRFGIAQLHQLRGRVGRGSSSSICFLVGEPGTAIGEERLKALVETTDGFELAEVDLELRGEGTIMADRQKGRNDLRLASLRRDREWVEIAREVAVEMVSQDLDLVRHQNLKEEISVFLEDSDGEYLLKS
ncbi:MAG: ATP-dependent DNA helicase RecG [Acidimicrobiales bacterium AG-410-I20]|nr:MAG: ATP-dependent DNA helicase RecG [Acidimicrobiales bacterium AG-410-I20]